MRNMSESGGGPALFIAVSRYQVLGTRGDGWADRDGPQLPSEISDISSLINIDQITVMSGL